MRVVETGGLEPRDGRKSVLLLTVSVFDGHVVFVKFLRSASF